MQSISKRTDDMLTSDPSRTNNKESGQHELGDNTVVFDYIPLIYMRGRSVMFGGNWKLEIHVIHACRCRGAGNVSRAQHHGSFCKCTSIMQLCFILRDTLNRHIC